MNKEKFWGILGWVCMGVVLFIQFFVMFGYMLLPFFSILGLLAIIVVDALFAILYILCVKQEEKCRNKKNKN